MDDIDYAWRSPLDNEAVNALHADAFNHDGHNDDWRSQVEQHSFGWVTATDPQGLIGFVNVIWDGGIHAWIQDVIVATRRQRSGIGRRLVAIATEHARAAGCEWLHVDFDDELGAFYYEACGFQPTAAGLIAL